MGNGRRNAFELLDAPALRPLPSQRYAIGRWKTAKVNIDYHVEFEGHYYSVPHRLVGAKIDLPAGYKCATTRNRSEQR